ncbi:MAG: hypothetical protein IAF94_20115 [Pirellulaceae bacterium]|nr:hypothetical protein [Pirellulaceae bacterium]
MPAGAFCPRFAALVLTLCCAMASLAHAVGADVESPFEPRTSDQIWLVNTRDVCDVSGGSGWSTARYDAGYWKGADDVAFLASDDQETVTVIYVHGNRMDSSGAEARGLAIYRELFSSHEGGKVRFVIWSWPSTQIHGLLKDVRAKAARSDDEAYLLARFLAPIPANRRVGLIGFSYGARIIGGSLHILGGGEVVGRALESGERTSFRVVLWAAGIQNDWLLPGNVQGRAMPLGQSWLNIYSSCDSVLWRFDRIDKCDGSPALGYVGLAGGKSHLPADLADRYEDIDVAHLIGGEHRSEPYFFTGEVIRRTREAVLAK